MSPVFTTNFVFEAFVSYISENKGQTDYQYLRNTAKIVPRRNVLVLNAYIRQEKLKINHLSLPFKKKKMKPQESRKDKILNIGAKIHEIRKKKQKHHGESQQS